MLGSFVKGIFGSVNDRYIKSLRKIVDEINAKEPELEKLSDEELKAKTPLLKERLAKGETLDDILPDAFAVVREASKRTLGLRPFDVQLIGGIVLHRGRISEMKTGEGKTLVATMPVYLNALTGKGVHVVTVNDYLAKRDSEWMGAIYKFLGLSVGCIVHELNEAQRREAYNCDVTYGTNNELGFDYLRDNMKFSLEEMVQRPFNYAIVDEVDSILIDEARTPLIISGAAEDSSERYVKVDALIPKLDDDDFEKDEKQKTVTFTDKGSEHIEKLLTEAGLMEGGSLYEVANIALVHHVDQALRAHKMFTRDVDYIVKDDKVVIIDEFTGRMMEGRRYADGLHQAIEAKEHVTIQSENQTLASITFQNYFRLYPKLAGMTGTAMTEAGEFSSIYNLEVVEIPTNVPCNRHDEEDEVYRTAKEKYQAIIKLIEECQKRGQPVLLGTTSIEKSEHIAELLRANTKIKFEVLNARHHEREAAIIAQAGVPGAVTIATNMAGRGTDIQLGGNVDMRVKVELADMPEGKERDAAIQRIKDEVESGKQQAIAAGGLYVIGTERHESRRIDNQLRGRSGRQGDPGNSKFFLSLEDDLMRVFGTVRMDSLMRTFGFKEGEAIIHPWITKAMKKAQEKVEAYNFDIRKNLLKYDDVMNDQRKVIYEQRRDIMKSKDIADTISDMRIDVVTDMVNSFVPLQSSPEEWDIKGFDTAMKTVFGIDLPLTDWQAEDGVDANDVLDRTLAAVEVKMHEKEQSVGEEVMRTVEKSILLQVMDQVWKEHLQFLDYMRYSIFMRAYGQRDPLNEYKKEAFNMFKEMLDKVRERTVMILARVQIKNMDEVEQLNPKKPSFDAMQTNRADNVPDDGKIHLTDRGKIQRNAPCPCGSGKKYKHCCGKIG